MFGDFHFISDRTASQRLRYKSWLNSIIEFPLAPQASSAVSASAAVAPVKPRPLRVCCIEIGAGSAVPTVPRASEEAVRLLSALSAFADDGSECPVSFIRMNPEEPHIALEEVNGVGKAMASTVLSFTEPSIEIIMQIDKLLS
jgi:hypothetical protein